MALYDLVTLREQLINTVKVDPVVKNLEALLFDLNNIKYKAENTSAENTEYVNNIILHYERILTELQQPVIDLKIKINEINKEINTITHKLFAGNYDIEKPVSDINFVRNNRRIKIAGQFSDNENHVIKQRILLRTSWQYPALEIGCRDGDWTQELVAADPLYITDQYREFLDFTQNRFEDSYKNRLRRYQIVDHNLSMLPQGQFGFVFSWGYFNYVSFDTMTQYLKQIFNLLRAGGSFMFTYNDGDTPSGAGMAETFAQTYIPKSLLIPLCESLGFSIVEAQQYSSNISWLEIKKPGQLETIKAHQVLGEIKLRNDNIMSLTLPSNPSTIEQSQENI